MASTASKPVSTIAMAFAAKSASVDIPKPREVGLHAVDTSKHHPNMLPTPPNSISPTLPPHKPHSEHLSVSTQPPPAQVDSDIDLQDAVEHAAAQDQPTALSRAALSGLEAAGAITPAMLAKHHLPDILLAHGPMAIRHVLNHLAQSVPGFSRIPPTKARRLVVGALESRGGGGTCGEVEFEKVGWGRWDARMRGQPPREGRTVYQGSVPMVEHGIGHSGISPPPSVPDSYTMSSVGGLQIPRSGEYQRDLYSGSWTGDSILSSRDQEMEDMNMAEHEADKMSLDGSEPGSGSSSEAADDIPGLEDDLDDVTDQEDWAAIGPDALRRGNDTFGRKHTHRNYNYMSRSSAARIKSAGGSSFAKSVPHRSRLSSLQLQKHYQHSRTGHPVTTFPSALASVPRLGVGNTAASTLEFYGAMGQDSQEREAVEALLRMGSM